MMAGQEHKMRIKEKSPKKGEIMDKVECFEEVGGRNGESFHQRSTLFICGGWDSSR